MKLSLFCLSLLLSFVCLGQRVEFGFNDGLAENTAPFQNLIDSEYNKAGSDFKQSFAISVAYYLHSKYKIGVSASRFSLYYHSEHWENNYNYIYLFGDTVKSHLNTVNYMCNKALALKLFFAPSFTLGKMELYSGFSVGYFLSLPNTEILYDQKMSGYMFGLFPGCTYYILPHLGINAEVHADYLSGQCKTYFFDYSKVSQHFSLIDASFTLGIHFRF